MTRFLLSLTLIFMISGCGSADRGMMGGMMGNYLDKERPTDSVTDIGGMFSPRPFLMRNLPGGDDSYSVGFRDGCSTTINYGSGLIRTHEFKYDIDRGLKDKRYYAGYRAGTVYCTYFADVDPL